MQYKTIVLNLLQQHPQLHDQLRAERRLLATVDKAAGELKASHESLTQELTERHGAVQASSMAFEMAVKEMQERLLPESETEMATTAPVVHHSQRG